jgi:hypothetical protein
MPHSRMRVPCISRVSPSMTLACPARLSAAPAGWRHKDERRNHGYRYSAHPVPSGSGFFFAADTMRLVQKELPVSQGCFRILINCDDDCLDVLVTPPFARCPESNLGQGFNPWRMTLFVIVPFERFSHHERPPKTLLLTGLCCSLSRPRSVHNRSMPLSILSNRASADVVEMPAR